MRVKIIGIYLPTARCKESVTYLLTPWSRVLLEKLTGLQLVKKFPVFYGTWRFITALTSAHHLSLSWASSIQSAPPHPTSRRSILILSSHLRLGLSSGLLPSGFPTKTLYTPPCPPYELHALPISFFLILSPAQYWVRSTDYCNRAYMSIKQWECITYRIKQSIQNIQPYTKHTAIYKTYSHIQNDKKRSKRTSLHCNTSLRFTQHCDRTSK